MSTRLTLLLAAAVLVAASSASAKTSDVTATGFQSAFHEDLDATPDEAWQSLVHLSGWWSALHTFSGNASNLSLDAVAGGCWCERWSGNSVEHARVLISIPGKLLRVEGGLGPLQALGATGILTFKLTPRTAGAGTTLDVTYRVSAVPDAGVDKLAPAVDGVLGEQVGRLVASMKRDSEAATKPK
jgi:hypothetical protein